MTSRSSAEEVVIVGAGPAGMLLAFLLVENGRPVHVVERHRDFAREFRGEGIQASVVAHLRELNLLDELLENGAAIPAQEARVLLDDRPVAVLRGVGDESDFGIILHQAHFLAFLHDRLEASPLYRATFGATVQGFELDGGRVCGVSLRGADGATLRVPARAVVVAAGRGTPLRKALGLRAAPVDTHFNILWIRLPRPNDASLMPQGFRAHLTGDALFILYTTADGDLQMAWGRRDERGLKDRDFQQKKRRLLQEAPAAYQELLERHFTKDTVTQFLNVQSDRLERWQKDGVLFVGDAAHTMSPVAGQGINLAMRDAIVAANHLIASEGYVSDELGMRFQHEREPEVRAMQTFQRFLGYFMLGAPRWQIRLFFHIALPVLGALGIRRRLLLRVQGGVTRVRIETPNTRCLHAHNRPNIR